MKLLPFEHSDQHVITELQPEGWPDIRPTIEFYTGSAFCFPFKIATGQKITGIGTVIIHHDVAWLAHIIVHRNKRRGGIGQFITQKLIEHAKVKNCDTVYLIATDLGEPVYKKAGFETETEYVFFKDMQFDRKQVEDANIVAYSADLKIQISNMDQQVSGENRLLHLEPHLSDSLVYAREGIVQGFYLPTFGEGFIAAQTEEAGLALMQLRMSTKVNVSFPADNKAAAAYMQRNNFKPYKTAKRMRLGPERKWHPGNIYNRAGGNLG